MLTEARPESEVAKMLGVGDSPRRFQQERLALCWLR